MDRVVSGSRIFAGAFYLPFDRLLLLSLISSTHWFDPTCLSLEVQFDATCLLKIPQIPHPFRVLLFNRVTSAYRVSQGRISCLGALGVDPESFQGRAKCTDYL